jgi:hypothetical protein
VRSSRNNRTASLALVFLFAGTPSAHRRDEYLQAARVAIDPARVEIELDLTPGIAVAEQVLSDIDRDGNRSISDGEARAYRGQVLGALAVDVDGKPLPLESIDGPFPEIAAVLNGEGTLRMRLVADLPRLSAGTHRLRYRNSHRPDIGIYLVNARVPASDRIAIESQRRDVDQRDVTIEYTLAADLATRVRGGLSVALTGAVIWLTTMWWRRRRRR